MERGEPDICANEEDRDTIDEEQPIEHGQRSRSTNGDENEGGDESC